MAYPYFNSYQQMNFPQYQQMPQMNGYQNGSGSQMPQMQQIQQPAPVQTGFVRVQSEDEAKRYTVLPGVSVTFIDDNAPYCYVKSVPLSQLEPPTFKRYRLVEEEEAAPPQSAKNGDMSNVSNSGIDLSIYAKNADIDVIRGQIDDITALIEKMRFDIDALGDKSTKKMVQKARKDADEE